MSSLSLKEIRNTVENKFKLILDKCRDEKIIDLSPEQLEIVAKNLEMGGYNYTLETMKQYYSEENKVSFLRIYTRSVINMLILCDPFSYIYRENDPLIYTYRNRIIVNITTKHPDWGFDKIYRKQYCDYFPEKWISMQDKTILKENKEELIE